MNKQTTQAIFFDFDGVIVDSTAIKTEAFRELFSSYSDTVVNQVLAYHKQHGGISRVEKIRYAHHHLLGSPLDEKELGNWAARYAELVVEKVVDCRLIDGAQAILERMHSKIPLFVISGTPEDELEEILKRRGMTGYFSAVHGSPVRKPEHIRNLLERFRLVPSYCLFVGDAMTDYLAAKETGMPFVGIKGETPFPEGTVVLNDCTRLEEWVKL